MVSVYSTGGKGAPLPTSDALETLRRRLPWLPYKVTLRNGRRAEIDLLIREHPKEATAGNEKGPPFSRNSELSDAAQLLRHAITVDRAWPFDTALSDDEFVAYFCQHAALAVRAAPVDGSTETPRDATHAQHDSGSLDPLADEHNTARGAAGLQHVPSTDEPSTLLPRDTDTASRADKSSRNAQENSSSSVLPLDARTELLGIFYVKSNFPGRCDHICNGGFVTAPYARRIGVGSAMASTFLRIAKDLGFKAVLFNLVFANNPASVALWQKVGFVRLATLPRAARMAKNGSPSSREEHSGIDDGFEYVDAYQYYYQL